MAANKYICFDMGEKAMQIGQSIPDHSQKALELYVVDGIKPGGFLEACLAGDMFRAVKTADTANAQRMWGIMDWVMNVMPPQAWGSYEHIEYWCEDPDGHRATFKKYVEEQIIMKKLKQPVDNNQTDPV